MKVDTTERQLEVLKDAAIIKEQNHKRQIKEMADIHLNVLLVEDDCFDRQHAKEIIEENYSDIKLKVSCTVQDALKELIDCNMDLLLLDISLPDGTAFDLVRAIREIPQYRFVHIVFITGDNYDPLKTFSTYHCYAFIRKPYERATLIGQLTPILEALKREKLEGRVPVRRKARIFNTTRGEIIITVDDILYAEIRFRDMIIHTEAEDYKVKRMSIKAFLEYIDDPDFFRCHESFVVNLRKVIKLESIGHRDYIALLENGDKDCIVSQRNYCKIKELLDEEARKRDTRRDV